MRGTFTKAVVIALLLVAIAAVSASATGTLAGTQITNSATVSYKDVGGHFRPEVTSNTVTTTVNRVCGVDVSPSSYTTEALNEDKIREFAFTITNTGNDYDTFNLALSTLLPTPAADGWTATIYHDADGDGVLDAGETTVTNSTGLLHPTAPTIIPEDPRVDHYHVIVQIVAPDAPDIVNLEVQTTLTAWCTHVTGTVSDSAHITMTVRQAVMTVNKTSSNANPIPLVDFDYTISVTNSGVVPAYDVVVTDVLANELHFIDFVSATPGIAIIPVQPSGGTINWTIGTLAAGATATLVFTVEVTQEIPVSTIIKNTAHVAYDDANDYHFVVESFFDITVAYLPEVDIESDHTAYCDPSEVLVVPFTIENKGNGDDVMELTFDTTGTTLPLTWAYYRDVNESGSYDIGDTAVVNTNATGGIDTGTMHQNDHFHYVAVATVPADAADTLVNVLKITATTTQTPTDVDFITFRHTCEAPILEIVKEVDKATANPGEVLTYTITVRNVGTGNAEEVTVSDSISAMLPYVDYVVESIRLDGAHLTDAMDADNGRYNSGIATVSVYIPHIDGTHVVGGNVDYVVTFQVRIK